LDLNPRIELNVVPNCGHVVNVEQADVFNTISIQFIRKLA
jgi:pimeloyl-ACP methyl ester carboxylesterase